MYRGSAHTPPGTHSYGDAMKYLTAEEARKWMLDKLVKEHPRVAQLILDATWASIIKGGFRASMPILPHHEADAKMLLRAMGYDNIESRMVNATTGQGRAVMVAGLSWSWGEEVK